MDFKSMMISLSSVDLMVCMFVNGLFMWLLKCQWCSEKNVPLFLKYKSKEEQKFCLSFI